MELVYLQGRLVGDVDRAEEGRGWFGSWMDEAGEDVIGCAFYPNKREAVAGVKEEWTKAHESDAERARKLRTIRPFTYQGVRYFPTHNEKSTAGWVGWSAELVDGSSGRVHGRVWARGITRRRVMDALADWVNFRLLKSDAPIYMG